METLILNSEEEYLDGILPPLVVSAISHRAKGSMVYTCDCRGRNPLGEVMSVNPKCLSLDIQWFLDTKVKYHTNKLW